MHLGIRHVFIVVLLLHHVPSTSAPISIPSTSAPISIPSTSAPIPIPSTRMATVPNPDAFSLQLPYISSGVVDRERENLVVFENSMLLLQRKKNHWFTLHRFLESEC